MDSLVDIILIFSFLGVVAYVCFYVSRNKKFALATFYIEIITTFILLIYTIFYSYKLNRLPFSTHYETVLILGLAVAFMSFYYYFKKGRDFDILIPLVFLFPVFSGLLNILKPSTKPLLPALRSPWLFFHVMSCMISYSFFIFSGVAGLINFFRPSEKNIDVLYSMIRSGFVLLTVGIITGSIWACDSWGNFWSWDPKEIWAFISWFYYLIVIHMMKTSGIKNKVFSFMLFFGFLLIAFTYFGVSYILPGLHSYVNK